MKKDKKQLKEKKKKQKIIYIDDGSTVVDMDVEGMPWHKTGRGKKNKKERLNFKEKFALILGAYKAYLPYLIIVALTFGILFLLMWLWLGV